MSVEQQPRMSYPVLKNSKFHRLRWRKGHDEGTKRFSRQVRIGREGEGAEEKEGVLIRGRYKLWRRKLPFHTLKVDLITRRYKLA